MSQTTTSSRRYLSRGARNTLLTIHIALSVGLLGDTAGFLAVAIRAATTSDAGVMVETVKVLKLFGQGFGIPLSFGALLSGVALGLGSRWGVLRYPWVVTKLLLIVSVILVGGLVIGPALTAALEGSADAIARLIAAASYDVIALTVATGLSVFKPGKPFRSRTTSV
ncbi:MAG: hypothetical protein ACREIA_16385 [Opitutaceae bacterium]